ncbi:NUDIX hydrolase [Homoserinibacter sp. YIM 151385]|uniref:NUDIX hydrolase n=1 Tax=Homoserinibacter sp. YIM 151385 TaxID=2985506 RepID=UPI0022F08980|nr:NUDIX domain-containing protein [Homoserinibacter sp. YIM 151385]WBU38415.1 NUDIX domain-containing protein [Homoserinibacter sp. YIM 151385]
MGEGAIELAVSTVIFALQPEAGTGRPSIRVPLVRRTRAPFEGGWALPGGWADAREGLAASARRTLAETTGLEPAYLEQLYTLGAVDRSPTGRVVSVVYWALVRAEEAEAVPEGENVAWFPAEELPQLAFDHARIVEYALWRLRTKMEYSRIAHALLGETFTISELRRVHEAVRGVVLDPANFRRHVESSPALVPTGERLTGGAHRPPRLYRYDTEVRLADNGPLDDTEESR